MWGNNIVLPPCAGIVLAEDLVTSPLPAIQEFSTGEILSGAASPTTSKHTSTAVTTDPTTAKSTTEPPTTPHHNITNSTTEAPTTTHHNVTNSTTVAPTTTHHNITNSTTVVPTTTHHNVTNSTTVAPTTTHHNITNSTTQPPTTTATAPPPTTPPVPNPTVGNYSVKSDNVTVCLLAKMGLQFSFKMSAVGTICLCRGTQEFKFSILCEAITHLQVLFCSCFLEFQLSDS